MAAPLSVPDVLKIVVLTMLFSTMVMAEEPVFNVKDFGARGDGVVLDTGAIQKAIDACHSAKGGTVLFPAGTYRSGTLALKSNVKIHLDKNARLLGSVDFADYIKRPAGEFCYGTSSSWVFIHGVDVENVTIDGTGTIDGARAGYNDPVTGQWQRGPLGILFERSKNILLKGVTVTQIPGWAVTFFECEHVELHQVHVLNVMADGINPVCCRHAWYDGVDIDGTGDDPITIKNEGPVRGPMLTSDILISNCSVRNTRHPGVKIGTGTAGVFRNILVTNCEFDLSGTVFAIQLMRSSQEMQRVIEKVELSDITVKHARQLFDITVIGVERPVIRDLKLLNIAYAGEARGGEMSRIWGTVRSPIENVTISNLTATDGVKSSWLSLRNVRNAKLSHFQLDLPHARTALAVSDCKNLLCDYWTFRDLSGPGPLMTLTNVDSLCLANLTSPAITNFMFLSGAGSRNVTLRDVNTDASIVPVVADTTVPARGLADVAEGVQLTSLSGPRTVKPNDEIELKAVIADAGRSGPYRLRAFEGKHEVGAQWVWVFAGRTQAVSFHIPPFFRPGRHELTVANLSTTVQVAKSQAEFVYGEYAEIISPAKAGGSTQVQVTVKNIGGSRGTNLVELRADSRVVSSQALLLEPGAERKARLSYRPGTNAPRTLTLGDFPPWPFFTTANVGARYFWGHHRLAMEAGGEQGRYDQYATIYYKDVPGDFDAVARVLSQSTTTGNNAAIGLIIRNHLDDFNSAGFTTHLRVPMYGGYKIWYLDLNNDGVLETRSDVGDGSLPCWYKFEKRGSRFRAYYSVNRREWTPCGKWFTITSAQASQDVGIFGNASSGLGEKSRVEFSDFEIVPVASKAAQSGQ